MVVAACLTAVQLYPGYFGVPRIHVLGRDMVGILTILYDLTLLLTPFATWTNPVGLAAIVALSAGFMAALQIVAACGLVSRRHSSSAGGRTVSVRRSSTGKGRRQASCVDEAHARGPGPGYRIGRYRSSSQRVTWTR